jgi:hypothetical protein
MPCARQLFLSVVLMACADAQTATLELENEWVRVERVTYGPGEKLTLRHPELPTIYIYLTDAGPIRFKHETFTIERRPVRVGGIRFSRGAVEKHTAENLTDAAGAYVRVELKTEPVEPPRRDVRLDAEPHAPDENICKTQFENGQVRIVRMTCAAGRTCPPPETPDLFAVVVALGDGIVLSGAESRPVRSGQTFWHTKPVDWRNAGERPLELVRLELKSKPVAGR